MGLQDAIGQQLNLKGGFIVDVKRVYARAYAKALAISAGVLTETAAFEAKVDHKVRDFTGAHLQKAHKVLDELNRKLAEQAIPESRRGELVTKRLAEKAAVAANVQPGTPKSRMVTRKKPGIKHPA